jgi:ribonuclease D
MTPIVDNAELQAFCERLTGAPFVAVDTEFMRETTYWPKLCLVQVASAHDAACIDPLAPGLDLQPLLTLLADERTIKVFHAARQDLEIFHNLGSAPRRCSTPSWRRWRRATASRSPTTPGAADAEGGDRQDEPVHRLVAPAALETQLAYALADVTQLAKVYPKLMDRLNRPGGWRGWRTNGGAVGPRVVRCGAGERLAPAQAPQVHAQVPCGVPAAAAWRERTAQSRDQPRGRILKDDAIDELATQLPMDVEALNRLRSVPKGFGGSRFGAELVETIAAAVANAEDYAP